MTSVLRCLVTVLNEKYHKCLSNQLTNSVVNYSCTVYCSYKVSLHIKVLVLDGFRGLRAYIMWPEVDQICILMTYWHVILTKL